MALDRRGFAKSLSGVVGAVLAGTPARSSAQAPAAATAARAASRLSPAKVTRIRLFYPQNYDRNGPQAFPQSNMVVLVDTDAGITGVGQGGSPDTVRNVARSVIGRNAFDTEMIWQAAFMDGFYSPGKERLHALGAIDIALWDIKGKALGAPLYQLFGGKAREHIELAFVAAVQHLPPRQRAVLLLRDVMGFSAAETASLIDTSAAAVNSALQRARALLEAGLPHTDRHRPSGDSADLVRRYMAAWHATDVDALVALMRSDASMAMPPTPSWYQGRDSIGTYLRQLFETPFGRDLQLAPSAANRQPALVVTTSDGRPFAVKLLTADGDAISSITGFVDPVVFTRFGP